MENKTRVLDPGRRVRTTESKSKPGRLIDISTASFNPEAPELTRTWSSNAQLIYTLNAYPNGITLSAHQNETIKNENGEEKAKFSPSAFHLRLKDTKDYQLPAGKYYLYKENYLESFEKHLSQLHKSGLLDSTVFYFGTTSDPFYALHKKFDVTMNCLELLERYKPALVVVQTRSPMVISALPILKMLGERAVVAINVETRLETSVQRYTPGQSRIAERLVAADGLRRQGIKVNLVVSPVLPYGDFYKDAWDFADMLAENADYVTFGSLSTGEVNEEAELKNLPLARRLEGDKQFRWLRPHSYRAVYYALKQVAPEKMELPHAMGEKKEQLSLFAA